MDGRKRRHIEQYQDMVARLMPERHTPRADGARVLSRTVTFQVTEDCNLACTYCYQGHKTKKAMSWATAKKAVDMLLSATEENNPYINPTISPGIILEFIGGEPFLQVNLIDKIVDYFRKEARRLWHPWAEWYCVSICSNGVNYFDEDVQRFLTKNRNNISLSVTIDGNKELHDSCRVFPDGRPSYDLAVAAAVDWMSRGYEMGSKITIAPENVSFLYDALVHMIDLGYTEINANCVYEDVWSPACATTMYAELKRVSDYLLEHGLENDIYISLFEEYICKPMSPKDNQNYCGGTCDMLCIDPDGNYSICIRYLPSSLGDDQPPIYLGNVDRGLVTTPEEKQTLKCMQCITRRSQSDDECFYCPIASGCGWCSALNYQQTGSANKRTKNICIMHKARALANIYFWNMYYRKHKSKERFKIHIPEEWALEVVSKEEFNMLKDLEKED